jgi:tight adherence protein B
MVPRLYVKVRTGRRQRALQGQLADGLGMIAEAVRAGHTFLQGVKMVAREMSSPISVEMQRLLDSIQLGRPVESALEDFAARNMSYDIGITVTAIGVQREVGGNLTETLDRIAETVRERERERVRGEVSALTAQGKLSGLVISLIPIGLLLVMSLLNPEYMGALTGTGPGRMLLAVAGAGWLIGFLMIGKITNVRY